MVIVILPAYNEEKELPELIARIDDFMLNNKIKYRVIVINDGSSDQTALAIERCAQKYPSVAGVNFPENRGVGEVMRTAFKRALEFSEDDEDVIVTMDADNTHDPKVIKMILKKIEEGYEVVVPSYFAPGGMIIGVPFYRFIFTIGANLLYHLLFYLRGLHEYTGFYRGYKVGPLKAAMQKYQDKFIESHGFAAMAEILVKLRKIPLFIIEVPMILRYDLKGEKSKLKILPTIKEHLKVISRNLFKRNIMK